MYILVLLSGLLAIAASVLGAQPRASNAIGVTLVYSIAFFIYLVAWSYYIESSRALWGRLHYLVRIAVAVLSIGWVWKYKFTEDVTNWMIGIPLVTYLALFVLTSASAQLIVVVDMPVNERRKLGIDRPVRTHSQIANFYLALTLLTAIPLIMPFVYA